MIDHFNYLKTLLKQKELYFAGPTLIPEDQFGILIFETESEETAKKLLENAYLRIFSTCLQHINRFFSEKLKKGFVIN